MSSTAGPVVAVATKNMRLGLTLALITTVMWATLPIAATLALRAVDPYTLTWTRFVVAALFTLVWLGLRGQLGVYRGQSRRTWAWLALAGLFLVSNYLLYLLGLEHTTPANAQVLIQSAPLLMGLGGLAFFGERYNRRQWAGLAVMVGGLALFSADQLLSLVNDIGAYGWGVLAIAVAAVTWAAYALIQKRLGDQLGSQAILLAIYIAGSFALLPTAEPSSLASVDTAGAIAIAYCCLNTVVAYGAFAASVQVWQASRVSAVLATTPLATLAMVGGGAALGLSWMPNEPISAAGWAGAAAVVFGSMTISLSDRLVPAPVLTDEAVGLAGP